MAIKKIANLGMLACSLISSNVIFQSNAVAQQSEPLCYWQAENNKVVDLGVLCGVKPVTETTSQNQPQTQKNIYQTGRSSNTRTDEETVSGLIGIYGRNYCEWMEAGGRTRTEAKDNAVKKVTDMLLTLYDMNSAEQFVNKYINISFFERADKYIKTKCPKYSD